MSIMSTTTEVIDADPELVRAMTREERRAYILRAFSLAAENIHRAARVWTIAEEMGDDLSDLRTGLISYLPRIASGLMDARVLTCFGGKLIAAVSLLPVDEQVRLIQGGTVQLVTDDGRVVAADPMKLTAPQVSRVFGAGGFRSLAEQKALLATAAQREAKRLTIDYSRTGGGRFLVKTPGCYLLSMVLDSMARTAPLKKKNDKVVAVTVELPEELLKTLRVAAQSSGKDIGEAFLQAARLVGMIDP